LIAIAIDLHMTTTHLGIANRHMAVTGISQQERPTGLMLQIDLSSLAFLTAIGVGVNHFQDRQRFDPRILPLAKIALGEYLGGHYRKGLVSLRPEGLHTSVLTGGSQGAKETLNEFTKVLHNG
jgi:hypothetical protein